MTKLTLEQWDVAIKPHLYGIDAGSEMVKRHVEQMMARPEFDAMALDHLFECQRMLETALDRLGRARVIYEGKPTVA